MTIIDTHEESARPLLVSNFLEPRKYKCGTENSNAPEIGH